MRGSSSKSCFLNGLLWTPLTTNNGRYVYQIVVPKALAPKDLVQVYESGNMVVLPPWDPMVRRLSPATNV